MSNQAHHTQPMCLTFSSCVSFIHLFVVAENERRFGNKDDSKHKGAGSTKPEDATTLVEQEDGEGDDQDGGGEEDGRGVAEGKPEQICQEEKFEIR